LRILQIPPAILLFEEFIDRFPAGLRLGEITTQPALWPANTALAGFGRNALSSHVTLCLSAAI
jgi:hypothetical protein